jgi:hypothetical protein
MRVWNWDTRWTVTTQGIVVVEYYEPTNDPNQPPPFGPLTPGPQVVLVEDANGNVYGGVNYWVRPSKQVGVDGTLSFSNSNATDTVLGSVTFQIGTNGNCANRLVSMGPTMLDSPAPNCFELSDVATISWPGGSPVLNC